MTKSHVLLALLCALAFPLVAFAHDGDTTAEGFHLTGGKPGNFKFRGFKSRFGKHSPAPSPFQPFVPPLVAFLQPNDKIAIAGDSVTDLGFQGGWVSIWQGYVQAYHPSLNLQFFDYGVSGNTSSDLLSRFPAVLQNNPTVVLIFIGLNDVIYGTASLPNQASNIQNMINQSRACPSVRMVVLVSPFCFGEQNDGENPYDSVLDPMVQSQANLAAGNRCGFINLRALWSTSEHIYNHGNFSSGVLTIGPPGIHPNALGAQLISGTMIKSFGE